MKTPIADARGEEAALDAWSQKGRPVQFAFRRARL
jgi:hypothetical protein